MATDAPHAPGPARLGCLLVDDHALLRDALALLIELHHPEVDLQMAGSLAEARQRLATQQPLDLVLLDLNLLDSKGPDTLTQIRQALAHTHPDCPVIVLSGDYRTETVMTALEAGAAGFIPKTADFQTMQVALRTVLAGQVYVPTDLDAGTPASPDADQLATLLTPRQMDVLQGLLAGQTNKEIARAINLSDSTVKTHVQAIFDRLNIRTRAQAVVVAARQGWPLPRSKT